MEEERAMTTTDELQDWIIWCGKVLPPLTPRGKP